MKTLFVLLVLVGIVHSPATLAGNHQKEKYKLSATDLALLPTQARVQLIKTYIAVVENVEKEIPPYRKSKYFSADLLSLLMPSALADGEGSAATGTPTDETKHCFFAGWSSVIDKSGGSARLTCKAPTFNVDYSGYPSPNPCAGKGIECNPLLFGDGPPVLCADPAKSPALTKGCVDQMGDEKASAARMSAAADNILGKNAVAFDKLSTAIEQFCVGSDGKAETAAVNRVADGNVQKDQKSTCPFLQKQISDLAKVVNVKAQALCNQPKDNLYCEGNLAVGDAKAPVRVVNISPTTAIACKPDSKKSTDWVPNNYTLTYLNKDSDGMHFVNGNSHSSLTVKSKDQICQISTGKDFDAGPHWDTTPKNPSKDAK